jgi:hypothetical protein
VEVKVRIREKPKESELDGVRLDGFMPGIVYQVSASVGAWLISNRYADLEMRKPSQAEDGSFSGISQIHEAKDHPHRRSTDR